MNQQLLFLHGAGYSDKNIARYLQDELEKKQVDTYSFNFTGHGGINLENSSLRNRLEEAEAAIRHFHIAEPLNICGSSMGGYIAVKLLEKYIIKNLILFAPAFYDIAAFSIPFNSDFSRIIRKEDSWVKSDAFEIIKKFKGNLLIFIGDKDEVIPKELIELVKTSSISLSRIEIIRIPQCPHKIHRWISSHPRWIETVSEKIADMLIN